MSLNFSFPLNSVKNLVSIPISWARKCLMYAVADCLLNSFNYIGAYKKPGNGNDVLPKYWNSVSACCYWVQNFWSSPLLYKQVKIRIYETIILPVVLYGCTIFSMTLRGEHKLRVTENKVLRRMFGPKRDEVKGGLKELHNELRNLYPCGARHGIIH
jgi:hypothetical protein